MIQTSVLTLKFGKRVLFEDVNIKFTPGNCYGMIGANGAGKSTFLKILQGEVEPSSGEVIKPQSARIAVLRQNHFEYDEFDVLPTVIMGYPELYKIMAEKEQLYAKPDFSDADGIRISELEEKFEELDGWSSEAEAATLLKGLGISDDLHQKSMKSLDGSQKVRVLLAQALFGNPEILLLDEPTNHLDLESIMWLEEFLINFSNTVIVVSHDRHFLNNVCTHIADIDFGKISIYMGNYDFWYQSSQLAYKQMKDANKKKEEKMKELQDFIARFASNASKAKQATSRKKLLDKISLDEIKPSTRKYPYVDFKPARELGKNILEVKNLSKKLDGVELVSNVSFTVNQGDKISLFGQDENAKTLLFKLLSGEETPDSGSIVWGETVTMGYFSQDHDKDFNDDLNLIDWLRQYSEDQEENFIRGFLGRMLFSGDEVHKKSGVLSGGEKVRCLLARMMLSGANFLMFDEPTNHLDLESITALNNGLIKFNQALILASKDHEFNESVANRILELTPSGCIDKMMSFDDYIVSPEIRLLREKHYATASKA